MTYDLLDSFPTLGRAPITEAILDIQALLPPDVGLHELQEFQRGAGQRFTERNERTALDALIEFGPHGAKLVSPAVGPDGYLFRCQSEPLVAQARLNGFTLSRLPPYHAGDQFEAEARELWEHYVSIARPLKVTRLAIRNINRIEVDPGVELEKYVLTGPSIARALPQSMIGFLMRIVFPDATGAVAILTETFGNPNPNLTTMPLIFDVDAFREVELSPDDKQIWNILTELRRLKNRVFFNSLTTQCLERYR